MSRIAGCAADQGGPPWCGRGRWRRPGGAGWRRVAAIGRAHQMRGVATQHPAIRDTLTGILRQHGAPPRRASAVGIAEIRRLVAACDTSLTGQRRALLLLGFAGALRRAELFA